MFDDLFPDPVGMDAWRNASMPPTRMPPPPPSTFQGFGKASGMGVMKGAARIAQTAGLAVGAVVSGVDRLTQSDNLSGRSLTDDYFKWYDDTVTKAVDYWTPDPAKVGTAGQIIGGLGEIVAPLALAGGNPSVLIATQGVGQAADLTKQGVDAGTAIKSGAVRAGSTALGMLMPAALVPGKLAAAGVGAVANAALGATDRAMTRAILEHADYDSIAAQYQPLDAVQLMVDAASGAAGGAIAGKSKPAHTAVTPEVHAAALAQNSADIANESTLVSSPDPAHMTAARDAQIAAAQQMDAGAPVAVADGVMVDPARVEALRAQTESRMRDNGLTDTGAEPLAAGPIPPELTMSPEGAQRVIAEDVPGMRRQPEVENDPIRQMVDADPDRVVVDPDTGAQVRAADWLARVDEEIATAQKESTGFRAAALCFLQHGIA